MIMGSNASRIGKKVLAPFKSGTSDDARHDNDELAVKKSGLLFVFSRRGSMYKDEDGDLAHEFYIEEPSLNKGRKSTMRRVYDNLRPQGEVYYEIARLHVDYPYIISSAES